jgi:hypothetical protein
VKQCRKINAIDYKQVEVLAPIGENTKITAMLPKERAEKIVALTAIKDKTIDLAKKGADPVQLRTFVAGARRKLAEDRPDPDTYRKAAGAALAAREQM